MAVITELIEAGMRLKRGGNLGGAIEHFKQLRRTYPGHARIMFELAACWRAFGVPERALPLYRELLAMPKGEGLAPKDMPRLYTQLGATLLETGDQAEALATVEAGLRAHPSYRALRAWRIFALAKADSHATALLDALELMLESLAPSRWDIFEADVKAMVKAMREDLSAQDARLGADPQERAPGAPAREKTAPTPEPAADKSEAIHESAKSRVSKIKVTSDAPSATDRPVPVNLVAPRNRKPARSKKASRPQMGKRAVRIDISSGSEEPDEAADDDEASAADGSLKIPVDLD